jgi:hypothetical protein
MERTVKNEKEAEKPKNQPRTKIAAPNCVTIFGGGVTGLSAAHELVERGFRVQVWEPTSDDRDPSRGCDVGGLARTQWSAVAWEDEQNVFERRSPIPDGKVPDSAEDWKARATEPIGHLPWVFYIGTVGGKEQVIAAADELTFVDQSDPVGKLIRDAAKALLSDEYGYLAGRGVYCEVQQRVPIPDPGFKRAKDVLDQFTRILGTDITIDLNDQTPAVYADQQTAKLTDHTSGKSVTFFLTLLDGFPDFLPAQVDCRVTYRVRERWIPGEHGFRVFPAFYQHLFDTMRRTPILEPTPKSPIGIAQERSVTVNAEEEKYVETGRTVFDNLRETTKQVIAAGRGTPPAVLPRSLPRSFEGIRDWLRLFLDSPPSNGTGHGDKGGGGFGFTMRDLSRFQVKIFQYLTSCDQRRAEYENMTWLEFLGGEGKFSPDCVDVLKKWPRALVAMDAKTCDARTMGSVFVQLFLDDVTQPGFRDGTLTGPTSVAWLNPWRRYLEAQGVEFIHGRLKHFTVKKRPHRSSDKETVLWPEVECYEPRYPGASDGKVALMPGYFLLALPDREAKRVAEGIARAAAKASRNLDRHGDIQRTIDFFKDEDEAQVRSDAPKGKLRHMVGIQYFFDSDINWRDGHYYMPLTAWGLTAISQIRFWQDRTDWEHGYRGIMSVVFTVLDVPGTQGNDETAWESSPDVIAKEVWGQIKDALATQHLPEPLYWHLDHTLKEQFAGEVHVGYLNGSPLLINLPGEWDNRPGDLVDIKHGEIHTTHLISKYRVEEGIVMAGTFMKTYTRLTTMEAANESARHAVNAILQDVERCSDADEEGEADKRLRLTPCDIWPIEQREVDDFEFFKELDKELFDRGLEHFVEILDLDELAASALRGSKPRSRDPFDPLTVLTQLERLLSTFGTKMVWAAREARRQEADRS